MTTVRVTRSIRAEPAAVFEALSDVRRLPEVFPVVAGVEVLEGDGHGVGTRFRETRRMGKREMVTELEVVELVPNRRVRMVADSHGTVWDSVMSVTPTGTGCELDITMDCRAHALLPRLMNPLMKGLYRKGLVDHAEAVARWCE